MRQQSILRGRALISGFVLALLGLAVAVSVLAWPGGTNRAVSAEGIASSVADEKARISTELQNGGSVRLTIEEHAAGRHYPPSLPAFMHFPDETAQTTIIDVDAEGFITAQQTSFTTLEGEPLAKVEHVDGVRRYTSPDGLQTFDVPGGMTSPGPSFRAWLDGALEQTAQSLEEAGYRVTGSGTVAGREAVILERDIEATDSDSQLRSVYEVVVDNPIIHRSSMYQLNEDGSLILLRQLAWLAIEITP